MATLTFTILGGIYNTWNTDNIIEAQVTEAINKISSCVIRLPRYSLPADLTQVREFQLEYSLDSSPVFMGYVVDFDTEWSTNGSEITVLIGEGREADFKRVPTGHGFVFDNMTAGQSLIALRNEVNGYLGTTWERFFSFTSSPNNIYDRFSGTNFFEVLLKIAATIGGYVSFRGEWYLFRVKDSFASSGITLRDNKPFDGSLPSYGTVEEITSLKQDRSNLTNVVIPTATGAGEFISLANSNRTSPRSRNYKRSMTRKPMFVGARGTTGSVTATYESGQGVDFKEAITDGINKGVFFVTHMPYNNVTIADARHSINGTSRDVIMSHRWQETPRHALGWSALIHPVLPSMVVSRASLQAGSGATAGFNGVLISLQDLERWGFDGSPNAVNIDQFVDEYRATGQGDNFGTQFQTTNNETFVGGIMLDIVAHRDTVPIVPSTNQIILYQHSVIVGGFWSTIVVAMRNIILNTNMNFFWHKSSSATWIQNLVRVKAQSTVSIEDSASINKYGRIAKHINVGDYGSTIVQPSSLPTLHQNLRNAANTMYDKANAWLNEWREPLDSYQIKIGYLPQRSHDFAVGDHLNIQTAKLTNSSIVITERKHIYSSDGVRHWEFVLSTQAQLRRTFNDLLAEGFGTGTTI